MANLDQIMDYVADNQIYYKDVSGTTGSSAYQSWYYVGLNPSLPTGAKIVGMSIISTGSNRPAFCILVSNTEIRVYTNVASTPVSVRVLYMK